MSTTMTVNIDARLELFVDDALIDTLSGKASLRLHSPTTKEVALVTDRPWEGNMCGGYKTYFRDGSIFRMYYQAWHGAITEADGKATMQEAPIRIGYAGSATVRRSSVTTWPARCGGAATSAHWLANPFV